MGIPCFQLRDSYKVDVIKGEDSEVMLSAIKIYVVLRVTVCECLIQSWFTEVVMLFLVPL